MNNTLEEKILNIIDNKKGFDVNVIDVHEKTILADKFIVVSGTSSTHVKSLSDNIEVELKKEGIYAKKIEGYREGRWILMDYSEIIVHIFHPEERLIYNIEDLWENVMQKLG